MELKTYTADESIRRRGRDDPIHMTVDDLLIAARKGEINLAVYASGWFIWTAEYRTTRTPSIRKIGVPKLVENEFLFVAKHYIERFRDIP